MGLLNLKAMADTPVDHEPFDYMVVEGFLAEADRPQIADSFPEMPDAGSFPLSELQIGPGLSALTDEMNGPAFRALVERKFGVDLAGKPTMFTLRGRCDERDGRIHTDSKKKIITVLVYLNDAAWGADGGRLRLLRSGDDLNDAAAEVPPLFGTLLVFKRSDRSFHGHEPYVGPRRVLQMNWVVSDQVAAWEQWRHRVSAAAKRLARALSGSQPKPHAA
ncbi:MAG TPA: 2OG-Fe(II) oxygenase [Caulobacteraceae bacterium]|nr:2OG-Fe(II) oxygenase [Caulobacteraceae bacterium]